MQNRDLHPELIKYLKRHNLERKFNKQLNLLLKDFHHPSLNTEILVPKWRKIYSFRLDLKYRVIFVVKNAEVVVIDINDHYQ